MKIRICCRIIVLGFLFMASAQRGMAEDGAARETGYQDISKTKISDITLSAGPSQNPELSFKAFNSKYEISSQSCYESGESRSAMVSAATKMLEALREADYVSVKTLKSQRKDRNGLAIIDIVSIEFHFKTSGQAVKMESGAHR